jgi:hypothetical protein
MQFAILEIAKSFGNTLSIGCIRIPGKQQIKAPTSTSNS